MIEVGSGVDVCDMSACAGADISHIVNMSNRQGGLIGIRLQNSRSVEVRYSVAIEQGRHLLDQGWVECSWRTGVQFKLNVILSGIDGFVLLEFFEGIAVLIVTRQCDEIYRCAAYLTNGRCVRRATHVRDRCPGFQDNDIFRRCRLRSGHDADQTQQDHCPKQPTFHVRLLHKRAQRHDSPHARFRIRKTLNFKTTIAESDCEIQCTVWHAMDREFAECVRMCARPMAALFDNDLNVGDAIQRAVSRQDLATNVDARSAWFFSQEEIRG